MKLRQKCKNDPTLFLVANLKELMHLPGKFYFGNFKERYHLLQSEFVYWDVAIHMSRGISVNAHLLAGQCE